MTAHTSPSPSHETVAARNFVRLASTNQTHSGTVGRMPRMKPENEFLDPPVFMVSVLGLPFLMRIGREPNLALEVDEDGPSECRFCV